MLLKQQYTYICIGMWCNCYVNEHSFTVLGRNKFKVVKIV